MTKEEVVRKFIENYNEKAVENCMQYLDDDIEVRSSYVLQLFPESNGKLHGKDQVTGYLELIFNKLSDLKATNFELESIDDYFIVKGEGDQARLNYYLHYHVNDRNLIYLIKSNLTQNRKN